MNQNTSYDGINRLRLFHLARELVESGRQTLDLIALSTADPQVLIAAVVPGIRSALTVVAMEFVVNSASESKDN